MIDVTLVYEDDLSEAVMIQILNHFQEKFNIYRSFSGHGFGYLKSNIRGFNQASKINPHFMLTDLDMYECPVELRNEWIDFPLNKNFIFRIAVREVEAWLLADVENLSLFFSVSQVNFPLNPEIEADPKNTLIQLAKRSRKREIREDVVPINRNASIGPNYNGCLSEFVFKHWNIENAVSRSESLSRTIKRLKDF